MEYEETVTGFMKKQLLVSATLNLITKLLLCPSFNLFIILAPPTVLMIKESLLSVYEFKNKNKNCGTLFNDFSREYQKI